MQFFYGFFSNLMCGLFGCNSVFSCIYGECSKQKDGVPCGNMKDKDRNGILGNLSIMC